MTENECVETLQYLLGYENAVDKGELDLPNYLNSEEKEALKFILAEIQQYRAIGTVEEFKHYKHTVHTAELAIDSVEREKVKIRNKAIDETCLKIFNHLLSEIEWNRVLVDDWDALAEEFKEIAEQMKGGAT